MSLLQHVPGPKRSTRLREQAHSRASASRTGYSDAPVCGNVTRRCRDGQAGRLPTAHEDVLTAAVVERFPGESAIESFEAQARDVEKPQPFVLGCPPERTGSTIVQGDVDSVIADA